MLPKIDGFEVCREIRRRGRHARPDADRARRRRRRDRRPGARRRRLRHEAVQPAGAGRPGQGDPPPDRRARPAAAGRSRSASLRIDPRRREATVGERRLDLRAREFDLLVGPRPRSGRRAHPRRAARGRLGHGLPGRDPDGRRPRRPRCARSSATDGPPIETVRGIGYRLVPPPREPVRPTANGASGPRRHRPASADRRCPAG